MAHLLISFLFFSALLSETVEWQISNSPNFDWIHPLHEGISSDLDFSLSEEAEEALYGTSYFRMRPLGKEEWSISTTLNQNPKSSSAWVKPADLSEEIWQNVLPHLLPIDHPLKPKLDSIFRKKRVTASVKSMQNADFLCLSLRKWDNILVAAHHKLKGYLIKTYLDDQIGITEDYELLKRIKGAAFIRQAIQDFHYEHFFKVPNKWLYVLPDNVESNPNHQRKHFVLVVEDMKLSSDTSNYKKWTSITQEHLKAVYMMLSHVGLIDSVFPTNIPFAKDGKIAFIDTEHYHNWPVPFHRLIHYLAPDMRPYWEYLIQTNGG